MSSSIGRVKKFVRVAIVAGALGYAVWHLWNQNQRNAALWAAGTDRVA